jgi:hypothetical protein
MKKKLRLLALFISIAGIFLSCKKEKPCEGCPGINRLPIAIAGPDQVITLPTDSISLDGSASNDPDGTISEWLWKKISGPASFNIINATTAKTVVKNLVPGVYQFELKVTDAGALSSKDTMQVAITSQPPPPAVSCPPTNRPIINLGLTPLTDTRATNTTGVNAIVSSGNKIFFAGGSNGAINLSTVEIFNLTTLTWSIAQLSLPRTGISAVACANKVFFAGGISSSGPSSRVDIYDIATQSWTTAELSEARTRITTATIGNKVFFAGGCSNTPFEWSGISNKIDIYDLSTNTWSVKILSETKIGFTATAAENKIYFAGGWTPFAGSSTSSIIDIYDDVTGTWSTSTLNIAKGFQMGIFKNGKIYWAGGGTYIDEPWVGSNVFTCQVEVLEINNQATIFSNLSFPWVSFYGDRNYAFEKDDKIGFLNYDWSSELYCVDIYNTTTNTWSLGVFNPGWPAAGASALISAANNIYLIASGHLWKIEF